MTRQTRSSDPNKAELDEKSNNDEQNSNFPGAGADENLVDDQQMELPGEYSRGSNVQKFKPKKSFRSSRKLFITPGLIIGIVALAAAWVYISSKDEVDKPAKNNQTQPPENEQPTLPGGSDMAETELTETYTNDFLRLTFKYPKSWSVKDENDIIMIISPTFSYQKNDGSDTQGFFKIYIKRQASSSDGKFLGRGYAAAKSEKIAYDEPQSGQKTETFLTPFGLDGSNNFAYFVVQGNFNLDKGESLGPKYASEPEAYLIAGGFGSSGKEEPLATNLLSVDSFAKQPTYKTAIMVVKSLQLK